MSPHAVERTMKRQDLGTLHELRFTPRDEEQGPDFLYAYLTNYVDAWGQRTVYVLLFNGNLETWYLFEDEYEDLGEAI